VQLLDRKWSLIAEWVTFKMNRWPSAAAKDMEAILKELDPQLTGNAVRLESSNFVIAVRFGEMGTFFIISGQPGNRKVAWAVKDAARNHNEDSFARWAVTAATKNPPYGSVGKLPKRNNGIERFYVHAGFSQRLGGTIGNQISVWDWNGISAQPVFIKDYTANIETMSATFDGSLLKYYSKEPFRTFFSCGGCPESENEWTLRITNDGFEELGRRPVVPELEAIDELFYRIQQNKSSTDLAAPTVIAGLDDIFGGRDMLFDWKVQRKSGVSRLCIEALGRRLFSMKQKGAKFFIIEMKNVHWVSFGNTCQEVLENDK
jgi:hypothetical protein